jgi:5-methylcytosine-specific restriction enzyme subunit McrC
MSGFSTLEFVPLPVRAGLGPSEQNEAALTVAEVEELYRIGKRMRQRIIEHTSGSQVRFRQFVGLVRVEGRDIEILPKIEAPGNSPGAAGIRKNLLAMLLAAFDTKVHLPGDADSLLAKLSWLDVFIQIFCRQLAQQVRRGLTKLYRLEEDDLHAVRGRIVIDEQIRRNFIHKERVACEFDELDENHALNQLLKLALARMLRVARSGATQRLVRELMVHFDAVEARTVAGTWWRGIKLDRLNARFEPSRRLAQLFFEGLSPDVSKGGKDSFSLLFDMNFLFEEYVGRELRAELAGQGLSVSLQHCQHYLMHTEDGKGNLFQLKPDIVVAAKGVTSCIGDTKWKRLAPEERKLGVSQADLYQMLGYANRYGCERILMLYPYERAAPLPRMDGSLLRYQARSTTVLIGQVCLSDLTTVRRQLRALYLRATDAGGLTKPSLPTGQIVTVALAGAEADLAG